MYMSLLYKGALVGSSPSLYLLRKDLPWRQIFGLLSPQKRNLFSASCPFLNGKPN